MTFSRAARVGINELGFSPWVPFFVPPSATLLDPQRLKPDSFSAPDGTTEVRTLTLLQSPPARPGLRGRVCFNKAMESMPTMKET
jgi:hypothetical protein